MITDIAKAEQLIRTARNQQEARFRELMAQRNAIDAEMKALAESAQVWESVLANDPPANGAWEAIEQAFESPLPPPPRGRLVRQLHNNGAHK